MRSEVFTDGLAHLYGVIGWPLHQSLSPLLHNTGFDALDMAALYQRWEVPPEHLADFVASVRLLPIRGCSVTIPHKTRILPFLDAVTPLARRVGAVNTLYWDGERLCGDNTDVAGFLLPLEGENFSGSAALLLGAGGAARAAAAGLQSLPQKRRPAVVYVATPSNTSHLPLAADFGLTPLPWQERHAPEVQLVINATPLGMRGAHEMATPFDVTQCPTPPAKALAYDIVYNPLETRFLQEARAAGWRCLSGREMFYGQADAQFRRWTGHSLPSCVRTVLEAALDQPVQAPKDRIPSTTSFS